jgi:kumamolisin
VCMTCGDNGSSDGVSDGSDHVDFPGSSPYSLACGGTTLIISGVTISSEVVWNDLSTDGGATGGGVSATFPVPTWQANISIPPTGFAGRGVPDVTGDGDPNTGYKVQVDGSSFAVGGTSAVAPLWAGLVALFNQSLGHAAGYLNPNLYQTIALQKGTFRDITSGNNGDFSAGPGWDACSGWGSPNGAGLLKALSAGTVPTPTPTLPSTPTPAPTKPQRPGRRPVRGRTKKSAPAKTQKAALKRRHKPASTRGRKSASKRGRKR